MENSFRMQMVKSIEHIEYSLPDRRLGYLLFSAFVIGYKFVDISSVYIGLYVTC